MNVSPFLLEQLLNPTCLKQAIEDFAFNMDAFYQQPAEASKEQPQPSTSCGAGQRRDHADPWKAMREQVFNHLKAYQEKQEKPKEKVEVALSKDKFEISLDVRGFKPEDISVKIVDGFVAISGKAEETSEDGSRYVSQQFTRRFRLPDNINFAGMKSVMENDHLKFVAPLKALESETERSIPIELD